MSQLWNPNQSQSQLEDNSKEKIFLANHLLFLSWSQFDVKNSIKSKKKIFKTVPLLLVGLGSVRPGVI